MNEQTYYVNKLKECLSLKQRKNPNYSLRAYSRDLNIHASTLSQILKGKRGLPLKRASDIARKLELSPKETTFFMESFYRSKTSIDSIEISKLDDRYVLDESYYQVIAEWEHYAVLEMFELAYYDISAAGISIRLDITVNRAEVVLDNLVNCKLLIEDANGELIKAHSDVKTTEDIPSSALKKSHEETLNMGISKLDEIEIELRSFSSTTVAIDLEKLPEAKTIIREFRQKMSVLLKSGNKTDIYQLAVQFYPLTKMGMKGKMQ